MDSGAAPARRAGEEDGGPSARAELYLCLARAFAVPRDEAAHAALRDALADDLAELTAALGLDAGAELALFREAMRRLDSPLALLQTYSALFLVPPVAAHLNTGFYLDRAVDGGSVREMEQAYARCGLARAAGFHDLADHVTVQLEFVAWLYERAVRRDAGAAPGASDADLGDNAAVDPGLFLHAYARCWLPAFCADLEAAGEQVIANPYVPLARLLQRAVEADAVAPPVADARSARRQAALERARARRAAQGITPEALDLIRRKLTAHGLSSAHVPLTPADGAAR